jgi:hypothetical protein
MLVASPCATGAGLPGARAFASLYGAAGSGDHGHRHAMTRPRIALPSAAARVALSLAVLGLAACSFSFKSGGSSSANTGKPAVGGGHPSSSKPTHKPITKTDPSAPRQPAEPTPDEGQPDEGPTRTPPAEEPPPVVEPRLTAVCRIQDHTLATLCHGALDPIAADDVDAWLEQLATDVVVTRPSYHEEMQRVEGPQAVRDVATRAGGLRALLHLRPTDRIVATLANDCRECRRAFVAFEANTRSGTFSVRVETTQPPAIVAVELGSHMRRRHLGGFQHPTPPKPPTVVVPPAKPEPEPSHDIVVPEPKREPDAKPSNPKKKKVELVVPEKEKQVEP